MSHVRGLEHLEQLLERATPSRNASLTTRGMMLSAVTRALCPCCRDRRRRELLNRYLDGEGFQRLHAFFPRPVVDQFEVHLPSLQGFEA